MTSTDMSVSNATHANYAKIRDELGKTGDKYNLEEVKTLLDFYNDIEGTDIDSVKSEAQALLSGGVDLSRKARAYLNDVVAGDGENFLLDDFENVYNDLPPDATVDDIAEAAAHLFDDAEEVYGIDFSKMSAVDKVLFILMELMKKMDMDIEEFANKLNAEEDAGTDIGTLQIKRMIDERSHVLGIATDILSTAAQSEQRVTQA